MFQGSADAYDRLMGRFSVQLAPLFADFAGIEPGSTALDVGAGPGALTTELVRRLGAEHVAAAEPSEPFLAALGSRLPGVELRVAGAEELPWPDGSFDAALAQLVVNFMADAPRGARELRRVVRSGGVTAACAWDPHGGMQMLHAFGEAVRALNPEAPTGGPLRRYRTAEELETLWREAGLVDVQTAPLDVSAGYADFDDYWRAFESGVGPDSVYCLSLEAERQAALRDEVHRQLGSPTGSFTLAARAWAVRGGA